MRVMAPCSWNSGADAEGGCGVTAKAPNVELRSRSSSTPTPTTGGSVTTGPGHSTWQATAQHSRRGKKGRLRPLLLQ
jgi:hypothetical protein